MNDILEEYEHHLFEKSDTTIKRYVKNAEKFLLWLESKEMSCSQITGHTIKQYKRELESKDYSGSSLNHVYASLRSFIRFLNQKINLQLDVSTVLKSVRINQNTEKWLTPEEKNIVMMYFDISKPFKTVSNSWRMIRNAAIVDLMLHAGLRISEIAGLKMFDLDFNNNVLDIRLSKGAAQRYIPMNNTLHQSLKRWLAIRTSHTQYVFLSQKNGNPLSIDGIEHIFKRMNKKLGTSIAPHQLRHTFAHDLLDKGVDINKIKELLGHSDIKTTTIYLKPSKSELVKAVKKLDD